MNREDFKEEMKSYKVSGAAASVDSANSISLATLKEERWKKLGKSLCVCICRLVTR